jgi:hypothetical protein
LQAPLWRDGDLRSVSVACHPEPTDADRRHASCAPSVYVSPEMWDEADSVLFRPLSEAVGVATSGESIDVNNLDEVPDSSWFTNRLGARPMSVAELRLGGCDPANVLDPDAAADGSWTIDKGKTSGASPGFRVSIPGKGKYLFKLDDAEQPELSSAATVVGSAAYHAVGYNTTCEQVVYFRPSLLKLIPGLHYKLGKLDDTRDFDRSALDRILRAASRRGDSVRMVASAWLPGHTIGPFRYQGTRADDPNDVVAHEDRRELRANRVLAAWIGHVDAREQNGMDLWFADTPAHSDSSPGHVVHAYLDWGDSLGVNWPQEEITRRMGYSYVLDWGDLAFDFVRLGIAGRPWDDGRTPGHELFGYYDVGHFVPDEWKSEYPNPAFTRMKERDAAWMARILARFTPEMIRALAEAASFTDPRSTDYLAQVLEGRLARILDRYLTRLSPIADVHVEGGNLLCGVDLAEWRHVSAATRFRYAARLGTSLPLPVQQGEQGRICVAIPHVSPDRGAPDDAPSRYVRVTLLDGVAESPLRAHLYDLGPTRGYRLAGIERPAS